jgi:hypothetical protein
MANADSVFANSTSANSGTDEFWFQKWSKMDTPWRTLEREVNAPKFPNPMFQVQCLPLCTAYTSHSVLPLKQTAFPEH